MSAPEKRCGVCGREEGFLPLERKPRAHCARFTSSEGSEAFGECYRLGYERLSALLAEARKACDAEWLNLLFQQNLALWCCKRCGLYFQTHPGRDTCGGLLIKTKKDGNAVCGGRIGYVDWLNAHLGKGSGSNG